MNQTEFKSFHFGLTYQESFLFLKNLTSINKEFSFNKTNKEFSYKSKDSMLLCRIKFPFLLHMFNPEINAFTHFSNLPAEIPSYLLLLIRAGASSFCICDQGEITYHKTIKKYMVRKKQGKAQLTYQSLKGKARGGARLRLENSKEFFLKINLKLLEWKENIVKADLIIVQCSPRLWSVLYSAKPKPPFSKIDKRIRKIPITTYNPTFKELKRINYNLLHGSVFVQSLRDFNNTNEVLLFLNSI
ncbi:MAG: hypothetical protein ACFE9L_12075 [Candidatus Hodarchaeota archaeon]